MHAPGRVYTSLFRLLCLHIDDIIKSRYSVSNIKCNHGWIPSFFEVMPLFTCPDIVTVH